MLNEWIGDRICSCDAQSFKEGFVGESAQESFACVLDQEVKDNEGAELSMEISIFSV